MLTRECVAAHNTIYMYFPSIVAHPPPADVYDRARYIRTAQYADKYIFKWMDERARRGRGQRACAMLIYPDRNRANLPARELLHSFNRRIKFARAIANLGGHSCGGDGVKNPQRLRCGAPIIRNPTHTICAVQKNWCDADCALIHDW